MRITCALQVYGPGGVIMHMNPYRGDMGVIHARQDAATWMKAGFRARIVRW